MGTAGVLATPTRDGNWWAVSLAHWDEFGTRNQHLGPYRSRGEANYVACLTERFATDTLAARGSLSSDELDQICRRAELALLSCVEL